MKDGIAMMLDYFGWRGEYELTVDVQGIDEIEKLYYFYPDKKYEPAGMMLADGTELSLSDQPFLMQRAIANFQMTGALGAAAQFFSNDATLPANVFDMLPDVFDKKAVAQKFEETNYTEKIAALHDFHQKFRIKNVPELEVKFENTDNIMNTIKTIILSNNPESGF
jgi:hypothetical protein